MAVLDDLASWIDTSSTSFAVGTNLFKALFLDNAAVPNTATVLYETPGIENVYTFSTAQYSARVAMERPSVQAISRSTSYQTARTRAQTIYTLLDGLAGRNLPTSTGKLYHDISAAQAPFFLQRDENDRYLVACNYLITKAV
jgi:hypothetical protein